MLLRRDQTDRDRLAFAFADQVAADLGAAMATRGAASLAVSGGSTPAKFFSALAAHDEIDWKRVVVTLVDERWVDEGSGRSNAALVRAHLLQGPAAAARFVPLYSGGEMPAADRIAETNRRLSVLPETLDVVVLGMGNDGHTASFFPGGDTLETALSDPGPALALAAPGAGEPRVTLTLPRLLMAVSLYVHIEGAEKLATLERALGDGSIADMPIRAVLRQTETPVTVYWCP
ncbi:MAG: 6-phosphogluconolactonase [Alphaproteobacteria bacterium]|nr:6-phosphogluconolactonase [Alphaproteobacteria bacterium]